MIHSALVVLAGLAVAIYFIIDDAIDNKIKNCMWKHYQTTNISSHYNLAGDRDLSKIPFSLEDCKNVIDEVRKKTIRKIESDKLGDCLTQELKEKYLDDLMFKGFLDKTGGNSTLIKAYVFPRAMKKCVPAMPTPGPVQ